MSDAILNAILHTTQQTQRLVERSDEKLNLLDSRLDKIEQNQVALESIVQDHENDLNDIKGTLYYNDPSIQANVEKSLNTIQHLDRRINKLEDSLKSFSDKKDRRLELAITILVTLILTSAFNYGVDSFTERNMNSLKNKTNITR